MMLLKSSPFTDHLESIIHLDTQQHDDHIDLTVSQIHKIAEAGSLDFGGSEFKPAQKDIINPQINEGDDYGWWHLPQGNYQATMNENLKELEDSIVIIGPHSHTRQTGIICDTTIMSGRERDNSITMNFQVPEAGSNIKENARFAVLYLISKET